MCRYEFYDIELQTLDIRSEVILHILHVSIKEHHQWNILHVRLDMFLYACTYFQQFIEI